MERLSEKTNEELCFVRSYQEYLKIFDPIFEQASGKTLYGKSSSSCQDEKNRPS